MICSVIANNVQSVSTLQTNMCMSVQMCISVNILIVKRVFVCLWLLFCPLDDRTCLFFFFKHVCVNRM